MTDPNDFPTMPDDWKVAGDLPKRDMRSPEERRIGELEAKLRFARLQLELIGMMTENPGILRTVQATVDFMGD